MEGINEEPELASFCQSILATNGLLAQAIQGFVARPEQISLATAIAKTITDQGILVAEAGTGTGKTFAYLIPCLLSGKKTIVSTATKTLQDQLFNKDLPCLIKALKKAVIAENLKGRANYICRYRVRLHAEESRSADKEAMLALNLVQKKLPRLRSGERGELPEISEDSSVWPYVTSTTENCLNNECPDFHTCFLVKARRRAMDADIVVINHHLFFANSQLKEAEVNELLPTAEAIIFDEAHQLPDIASHFYGQRVSTRQLFDGINDLMTEWSVIERNKLPFHEHLDALGNQLTQLFATVPEQESRLAWETLLSNNAFQTAYARFNELLEQFIHVIDETGGREENSTMQLALNALKTNQHFLANFGKNQSTWIPWVERFKHTLVFHATPCEIATSFQDEINRGVSAFVFTSATLAMANSFDSFMNKLGLKSAKTLLLNSPFNYQEQALLYLPRGLPDPKHDDYYEALFQRALPVINACGGRCFFLFTSHRALKMVASYLENRLKFPLLVQGNESKAILLARFREFGNAVLLGTATFWEGVDVKGEALSCVIIDKLPFASPADPVVRGRSAYLKRQGLSAFDELSLPDAVLALKQGVGRLIRDHQDRGVLMIADPRLTGRDYGSFILSSLPAMRKTRDEETVLGFIAELNLVSTT